jgi:hypothetical protein
MKFLATSLFLLRAAACACASSIHATTGLEYDDQEDFMGRKLQGKKGGMNGGKKGDVEDCTDGATPISACETLINQSGRYILTNDLNCGTESFGFDISGADDVHLDCQGNLIKGSEVVSTGSFGIAVSDAAHVTVSNCHVSGFFFGFIADLTFGPWTDVVVRDSTFDSNFLSGMTIEGDPSIPSTVNVVGVNSMSNGQTEFESYGIDASDIIGTIVSTTLSNNIGTQAYGFIAHRSGDITLIDVTANGNSAGGIVAVSEDVNLNVINSIACGNGFADISDVRTAQATTCNVSSPLIINNLPICQCPCEGGSVGRVSVAGGDEHLARFDTARTTFPTRRNSTVVSAVP